MIFSHAPPDDMQAAVLGIAPTYGPHAARLAAVDASGAKLPGGYSPDSDTDADESRAALSGPWARAHTMFAWREPVSPHIAAATEGGHCTRTQLRHVECCEAADFAVH